ncbi:MAG TPA: NUDIX domain-containing protein [Geothrix sp.]
MTDAALALIQREGRWFLQRRDPGNAFLPGLWEFPGGKVEAGESVLECLRRELREEVGLVAGEVLPLWRLEGLVRLHPFLVQAAGQPRTELAWGWFKVEELGRLPIPPMNQALLAMLDQAPSVPELRPPPAHLIG